MKKILSLFCILIVCSGFLFADEPGDEYDDGYVYEMNGAGDQFVKFAPLLYIPLNFGENLKLGGAGELGYYRFLNKWLAVGGEASFSFNVTIAGNTLTTVPVIVGAMVQPTIGKFEFPFTFGIGFAYESAQNSNYFPGFAMKADLGIYFRAGEMWSFGVACDALWLPQWYKKEPKYNDNGFFVAPALSARYHF